MSQEKNYVLVDKYDPRRALVSTESAKHPRSFSAAGTPLRWTEERARQLAELVYYDTDVVVMHVDEWAATHRYAMGDMG